MERAEELFVKKASKHSEVWPDSIEHFEVVLMVGKILLLEQLKALGGEDVLETKVAVFQDLGHGHSVVEDDTPETKDLESSVEHKIGDDVDQVVGFNRELIVKVHGTFGHIGVCFF